MREAPARLDHRIGRASEKLAVAGRADDLLSVENQRAAHVSRDRITLRAVSLVRRVVAAVMHVRIGERDGLVRIEDHDVGVAADRDRALARKQAEQLGGVGADEPDECRRVDATFGHALGEEHRQARREAGNAVRDLAERCVLARDLLALRIVITRRRMVGRDDVDHAAADVAPERLLIGLGPRGRAEHEFRALEAGAVEVIGGERQVVRAGLGPHLQAARLRTCDLLGGFGAGDVEDLDRHVERLGERDDAIDRLALDYHRLAPGVILRRGKPRFHELLGDPHQKVVVLGVHADKRAVARAPRRARG